MDRALRARPAAADAGSVVALLPNGRALWLRVRPMPVAVGDAGRIVSLAGDASRVNRQALKANLEATRLVAAAIKRDAAVLSCRMLHQNRSLRRVLLSNAQRSHRRVSAELIGAGRRTRTT